MSFQLTVRAKEDMKNIARYTQEVWGVSQRNVYLKQIDDIFHLVAKSPANGRSCDEIRDGYYKYNVGKHVIFYRQISKKSDKKETEIQIVRILHSAMDVPNNL